MSQRKLTWREARDLISETGEIGVNQAQYILEDLVRFPENTQFYRTGQGGSGYLSYAGVADDGQPRWQAVGSWK